MSKKGFEEPKVVIRSHKSMKDRQHDDQRKKDRQHVDRKKDRQHVDQKKEDKSTNKTYT